jgi:hypothetical protein
MSAATPLTDSLQKASPLRGLGFAWADFMCPSRFFGRGCNFVNTFNATAYRSMAAAALAAAMASIKDCNGAGFKSTGAPGQSRLIASGSP